MGSRPTGTVTFLFTDVVGSTARWEADPQLMAEALALHDEVMHAAIEMHDGYVFATGGDGFAVAFQRADHAVAAATEAQRSLRAAPWPGDEPLAVRMGAHSGDTVERRGDYFGPAVNRAARVMDAANGGQLVVTSVTDALVPGYPDGVIARRLGAHRFKGLDGVLEVVELVVDGADDLGPLRRGGGRTHGLPGHRTSFVGRARELIELRAAAAEHRLVTLVAPGGSGKTRLVSELARELAADRPDGVWFVDLAEVRVDDDVPSAVAAALDLGGALADEDPLTALARWRATIILDNCEQVIDGSAQLADELLSACPEVTLLATSREALAVDGECVLPLGPLGGRNEGDEAVGLFLARARLVAPDFRPTSTDIADIAALCETLDRLPLAIELAAARVDRTEISEIADGLLRGRSDRRARRRGGRQGDLRSVLAWSTDLLDDEERAVWRRLAVFEGGFTADAAADVAVASGMAPADVVEVLDGLVDRSLAARDRTATGMRHHLLETIRAVALEELETAGESAATLDRHARWVEDWSAVARAAPPSGWLVDPTEVDNQRRALRHLVEQGATTRAVGLLADAITPIVFTGHREEADRFADELRLAAPDDPITTARLGEIDMIRAEWRGDFIASHTIAEELRSADADDRSWAIGTAIAAHHFAALDPPRARRLVDESVSRLGEEPRAIFLRAEAAINERRFAEAADEQLRGWGVDRVDELTPSVLGPAVDVTVLSDLAVALLLSGRTDEMASVLATIEEVGLPPTVHHYLPLLRSAVAASGGETAKALDALAEAAASERRTSSPFLATDVCVAVAHVAFQANEPETALFALGAVKDIGQRTAGAFGWRRWLDERLRPLVDDERAAVVSDEGAAVSPRDAVSEALRRLRPARGAEVLRS